MSSAPPSPPSVAIEGPNAPEKVSRARSGLGGSHTVVTYPPLGALEPMVGEEPFRIDGQAPVHLYVHVAFCEYICPFCHYQRTFTHPARQAPAAAPYVEALGAEMALRREHLADAPIASVYLGGGTPTSLNEASLARLLQHMKRLAALDATYFSFETSPKTAIAPDGESKLAMLVEAGAKRVSMGVQTFDEILSYQQRGHGRAELDAAIARVMGLGLLVNLDMIQDLPLQDDGHIDADLAAIANLLPDQVTWYTLRAQKGSVIGRLEGSRSAREAALFSAIADSGSSVKRRLRIIETMRELGYRPRPGGRFLRESAGEDVFKTVRNGLGANLLGFGLSSYSHGWGYFFRNIENIKVGRGIADYIERMRQGASPVATLLKVDALERAASALVQAARSFIPYHLLERDDESGEGWRNAARRCVETGLLLREAEGLRLTALGQALEEEVSSLFYSAPVRGKLMQRGEYWADPEWFTAPSSERVASQINEEQAA